MEDKTPYYATLAYDADHAQAFKKFCQDLGIKQKEFIPLAVEFFKKSGIDPRDPPEQITNDFQQITKRSENRLIGFIKTQDKKSAEEYDQLMRKMDSIIENLTAGNQNSERLIKMITE